ncbi:type I-C CRISPR-associated protein Cas8c/Csd1 [Geodermatophilus sp. SYSU D00691]
MLLQRLVQYAESHDALAPFHGERTFQWQLTLREDGHLEVPHLVPLQVLDAKGRPRGVAHLVPSAVRTSGVSANLGADDVQYVLGWADAKGKPIRVTACHADFVDLTRRWAASPEAADDPVPQALASFLASGGPARVVRPPEWTSKQGVVVMVGDTFAHRAPSAAAFWAAEVARRKGAGRSGLCLVCGRKRPLLDTIPKKTPAHLVPGATQEAALVSVNRSVFGYQLSTQLAAVPICVTCGEGTSAGLRLILSSGRTASFGGQDSRLAWWVPGSESDPLADLDAPDPERVTNLLRGVQRGREIDSRTPEAAADRLIEQETFCSLVVGGNVSRVMVRDWVEMPLEQLRRHIAAWFTDTEIDPLWAGNPHWHSLTQLMRAMGRWQSGHPGRYAEFGAKGADRPQDVHRDLLRAAIHGAKLPPSLLVHLVHRVCTDGRLDDARTGLIRLALVRTLPGGTPPMPGLDPTSTDPAYVCGRAFAVIEKIQQDFNKNLNTTYGDRYFAGAVTNPRAALVAGRRDATAWLKRLRRTNLGAAIHHEKLLSEVFDRLPTDGIPARTTLRGQAQFLLGYHHQRSAFFTKRTSTDTTPGVENPDTDQPQPEGARP